MTQLKRARQSWLRDLSIAIAVFASALTLWGCSPEDPFVPTQNNTPPEKNGSFLRVVHAASGGPAVRVSVDTTILFNGAEQKYMYFVAGVNEAKYYPVDSAAKSLSFLDGAGGVVASSSVVFRKNGFYTAYLYGQQGALRVLVTTDTVTPPDRTSPTPTKIRLVNLVPDAPSISLRFGDSTAVPTVNDVSYGGASNYAPSKAVDPGTSDLFITEAVTGRVLYGLGKGYVFIPAGATFTLVLSGKIQPVGDERFLMVAAFNESAFDTRDSLWGISPFRYSFAAIRFVNLTPGDSTLDVTFYDPSTEFAANDNFRRTLSTSWPGTLDDVHSLGHPDLHMTGRDGYFGEYLTLGYNVGKNLRYRVEYHQIWQPGQPGGINPYDYRRQDVFAPEMTFLFEESRRYTIVAFGPYVQPTQPPGGLRQVLHDDTPVPGSSSLAQVRLFHGAFGAPYDGQGLRLRIGGSTSPAASRFGLTPPTSSSFTAPAGAVEAEVVDDQGNVLHTQVLSATPLQGGKSYTVFLTRGVDGNSLLLHALSEEFRRGG